jgi:amino acid permease
MAFRRVSLIPFLNIGTGLFLGTASALHNAGPAGMVLGYIVMGSGAS